MSPDVLAPFRPHPARLRWELRSLLAAPHVLRESRAPRNVAAIENRVRVQSNATFIAHSSKIFHCRSCCRGDVPETYMEFGEEGEIPCIGQGIKYRLYMEGRVRLNG